MTTTMGSLDLNTFSNLYNDATQYFWFESDSTATYGAGVHITLSPSATFMSNPTGQNILINTDGISIRNGLLPMMTLDNDSLDFNMVDTTNGTYTNVASFGAKILLGESNSARVEISSMVIDVIADTGDSALKTETTTTKQTLLATEQGSTEPYFWINGDTGWLRTEIVFSRTGLFRAVTGTTISLSVYLGDTSGKYYTRTFVAGTDSYVVIGDYTITYNYNPNSYSCKFVLSGANIDTSLDAYIVSIQYYVNEYVPSNTLFGVNSLNGIVKINNQTLDGFVTAQTTDGIWTYRKWSNGKIECWGEKSWSNVACTTSAGGGYRSSDVTQSLPSGLFTAIDVCQATMKGSGGSGYTMALRTLCTPTAISQMFWNTSNATKSTCTVDYYIIGT